jgi:capsular polysaccharide biosynthesis protein
LTVVTAPQPGALVNVSVRSVWTDPVNAFAVIAYGAAVELGHSLEAAPRAFPDAAPHATTTASAPTIAPLRLDAR